jgi:hypothetical protein
MDIYNASSTLPSKDLLKFSGHPTRVVFHPGEQLYRFGTIVSPSFTGNEIFASPWWVPPATFDAIARTANRTNTSITDVARSRLAVAKPWNPSMDWLIIIELKRPVYAWVGPAQPQPLDGRDRSVLLVGNFEQAFVPGLAAQGAASRLGDAESASDAAMLVYSGQPFS